MNHFPSPTDILYCSSLVVLDATGNNFTGLGNFAGYPSLRSLRIGNNNITAQLPQSLMNSGLLSEFTAPNNRLSGTLSSSISKLVYLGSLSLSDNNISGRCAPRMEAARALRVNFLHPRRICST